LCCRDAGASAAHSSVSKLSAEAGAALAAIRYIGRLWSLTENAVAATQAGLQNLSG
jgi:hypothetical protein